MSPPDQLRLATRVQALCWQLLALFPADFSQAEMNAVSAESKWWHAKLAAGEGGGGSTGGGTPPGSCGGTGPKAINSKPPVLSPKAPRGTR